MSRLLARYLEQPALIKDRLEDKLNVLKSLRSMAGIHAAIWCIENANLIATGKQKGFEIACYEHLVTSKDMAWQKLVDGLGLDVVPSVEILTRPSQQARGTMGESASDFEQISSWQKRLTREQKTEVQSVLNLFEVDSYSVDEILPCGSLAEGGH